MSSEPRINIESPDRVAQLIEEAPEVVKEHLSLVKKGIGRIMDKELPPGRSRETFGNEMVGSLAWAPEIFNAWWMEEYYVLKKGRLDPSLKELIALVVAQQNGCQICIPYHSGAARYEGAPEDQIDSARNFVEKKGQLPEKMRKAIEFAQKVAYQPTKVSKEDIDTFKSVGYNDAEAVEVIATALLSYQLSAFNTVLNLGR